MSGTIEDIHAEIEQISGRLTELDAERIALYTRRAELQDELLVAAGAELVTGTPLPLDEQA